MRKNRIAELLRPQLMFLGKSQAKAAGRRGGITDKLYWRRGAYSLFLLCVTTAIAAQAQTLTTLFSFDLTDGEQPYAGLVQATNGDFYGTSSSGGSHCDEVGCGTVFKITPSGKLTTLYNFCSQSGCTDGWGPNAATLVLATDGNFYGTTLDGGANCAPIGCGTVFKITSSGKLTTLYSFCSELENGLCLDGGGPVAGLVQATNGNLYGTTPGGGANGAGTVFEITPSGTLTTLYSFCSGICLDGNNPNGGLIQATDGNLYGTTSRGGAHNYGGTVFEITPAGELTTLYSFCAENFPSCTDGSGPMAALVQAANGDFYGTTSAGGANGAAGTVFKITPSGKLTTLYSLCATATDEGSPNAALVQATDGNLYGTTLPFGGCPAVVYGTVFKITPSGKLTTLHNFLGTDGDQPLGGLVQATNGNLYGTTYGGGANNYGTVFSLSVGLRPFVRTQTTSGKEGAKIGILGQGFSTSSVVKFGGTKATTVAHSGTTFIRATLPAGALTGDVTVTTGTTTLTSSHTFKVLPAITSFTPASGSAGTSVTIKGTGLEQTTKVTVGGKSSSFTVDSDTELKADVPTDATNGKIAVTTKGGSATSSTSFTVD
jgi:uncharacterized repeat protein (TIGR03803 family)